MENKIVVKATVHKPAFFNFERKPANKFCKARLFQRTNIKKQLVKVGKALPFLISKISLAESHKAGKMSHN